MALAGKHVLVNGAWGAGAAIARHARARGAKVSVIVDALETTFLGKSEEDVAAAKDALLGQDGEGPAVNFLHCNSNDLESLKACCQAAGTACGDVDVLVNSSALEDRRGFLDLPADAFTDMQTAGLRRSFWATRYALDHAGLKKRGGHVLSVSPPIHLEPSTFLAEGVGNSMARFNSSMAAMGLAEELKRKGVAVNAVWPANTVGAASDGAPELPNLGLAAEWIVGQDVTECAGNFFTDAAVVAEHNLRHTPASSATAAAQDITSQQSFFLPSSQPQRGSPIAGGRVEHFAGRMPRSPDKFCGISTESGGAPSLKGKTLFVTGGSRGIGLAIAERASADGANVVLAAKTDTPHPTLPGTIHTAAASCLEKGAGGALALKLNIQDNDGIQRAVEQCVAEFGGIDILINNASAIDNSGSLHLKEKKFDLMHSINARGTHLMTKHAMPHLLKADNAHVLNISPPLDLNPVWFRMCGVGYTIAKYNMSLSACGLAEEFRSGGEMAKAHGSSGVAFNCLWPRTAIATAAMDMLAGKIARHTSRTVDIMADSAYWILTRDAAECTSNYFIDDDIAAHCLHADLDKYRYTPLTSFLPLMPDFFVGDPTRLEQMFDFSQKFKRR
eukprot:INCI14200.1.p1 GENE.INCI14200.1~~INCI14200.1.p1  ORF type:complete len:682 (+),score=122.06 INCI14200.1:200-2047(+)